MVTDMVIIEPSGAEEGVTDVAALRWPLVAALPAKVQLLSRTLALLPTDMPEVVGVISVVVRETKGCAQGLTLFLCGATSWLLIWLSQSPLVTLKRITIAPWN